MTHCYVLEIGYANGEAERRTYDTLDEVLTEVGYYSQLDGDMTYWLISKVHCERDDGGFNAVKWLEKPVTVRFGDKP